MSARDTTLDQLQATMRACRRCHDAGYDIVPGAVFSGDHNARAMIIGQAPGVTEVEAKRPFNAGSGRRLFDWLGAAGWDEDTFRSRHYMTAVTKCFPGKHPNGKGDRVPSRAEQALCRPFLDRELALVAPVLIIPVGKLAIELFFPHKPTLRQLIGRAAYMPPDDVPMAPWHDLASARMTDGWLAASAAGGRYVVPLPHPSGASLWPNRPENVALIDRAIALLARIREEWEL